MKRKISLFLFLIISTQLWLYAQDIYSDAYELIYNFFSLGTLDKNEGQTVFLSTMIPSGGSSESMGMAYTAVADDIAFIELNPAASCIQDNTQFALYHNNWIQDTRIESASYTTRFGPVGFAISGKWLYTSFTEYSDMAKRVSTGYYSEAIGIANLSLHLFPGYYFYGLALGANAKIAYRAVPDYSNNDGVIISGSGTSQSAMAIMADIGLLTRFNLLKPYSSREKNFSIGLALKNVGPPVSDEALPTVATAGISYKFIKPIQLSGDISIPINLTDFSQSEQLYWSVGYRMIVTSFWNLQAGLLVKSNNPRLSAGAVINMEPLTIEINYTLDLTTQISALNRMSIEVRFDMGDRGRSAKNTKAEEYYLLGLDAYAAGDIELAVSYWEESVKLNPSFDPSQENLQTAKMTLELQKHMLELQKLE